MINDSEKVTRIKQYQLYFDACSKLDKCMEQVLSENSAKLQLARKNKERDFGLLACALFGKANKTFEAVVELCALGFGEDALILLRSNLNLAIDFLYILEDDSVERAADCVANGHNEQMKFLTQNNHSLPKWSQHLKMDQIKIRANRWRKSSIKTRAEKAAKLSHYQLGYSFYSSLAHSDARALSSYIEENSVSGLMVQCSPSDKFVHIALVDNFRLMADVFQGLCSCFGIDTKHAFEGIKEIWKGLGHDMSRLRNLRKAR